MTAVGMHTRGVTSKMSTTPRGGLGGRLMHRMNQTVTAFGHTRELRPLIPMMLNHGRIYLPRPIARIASCRHLHRRRRRGTALPSHHKSPSVARIVGHAAEPKMLASAPFELVDWRQRLNELVDRADRLPLMQSPVRHGGAAVR